MRRIIAIVSIILLITSPIAFGELGIEAGLRSYILADFETGQILEEYNIDETVEMASISKLMSYLVTMDEWEKGNISLDDIISIDKDTTRIKGSSFKLKIGEEFTVKELIEASLVVSGNDATYALAKYIAGTEGKFVNMMNEKAKEIGLKTAVFYNSTGLPVANVNVQNKMSTREIFQLSRYIINKYPQILEITTIKFIDIPSREFFQRNSNPLLMDIEGIDGLKTGFTNKAGYCYVSTFNIGARESITKDLRLISIVMGAKNFEERNEIAKILVEYGLANYSYKIFLDRDNALKTLEIPRGTFTEMDIYPRDDFAKLIHNDEDMQVNISLEEIELPIKKYTRIGKAEIQHYGKTIFETDIIMKEDINRAKWYIIMARSFGRLINNIINTLLY